MLVPPPLLAGTRTTAELLAATARAIEESGHLPLALRTREQADRWLHFAADGVARFVQRQQHTVAQDGLVRARLSSRGPVQPCQFSPRKGHEGVDGLDVATAALVSTSTHISHARDARRGGRAPT